MKRILAFLLALSLALTACTATSENNPCTDSLGCVTIGSSEPVTIAVALTLSGPNAPYGIDALRGVELAIADHEDIFNHPIELIQEDDLCTAEGGQAAAERLAQNPNVVGVIGGATCSDATEKAAVVLSEAGMVLISPSSTAASLTSTSEHEPGFLRTIYNDQSQAKMVADFAFNALGARTMATIHDSTAYSDGLQQEACQLFEQRGGTCVEQLHIATGGPYTTAVQQIAKLSPDVLYIPLYAEDAMNISSEIIKVGLLRTAVIGSDGLLSSDFAARAKSAEGMYISGPSTLDLDPDFKEKYRARYGEEPIAVYAAQAYDAAMMLFSAIEASVKTTGSDMLIPRKALREALFTTKDYQGLSGVLTCSPLGDCAPPNIVIYQLDTRRFRVIYP